MYISFLKVSLFPVILISIQPLDQPEKPRRVGGNVFLQQFTLNQVNKGINESSFFFPLSFETCINAPEILLRFLKFLCGIEFEAKLTAPIFMSSETQRSWKNQGKATTVIY